MYVYIVRELIVLEQHPLLGSLHQKRSVAVAFQVLPQMTRHFSLRYRFVRAVITDELIHSMALGVLHELQLELGLEAAERAVEPTFLADLLLRLH